MKYRITVITGIERAGNGASIPLGVRGSAEARCLSYAADKFGGVTLIPHYGNWLDGLGQLVTEAGRTFVTLIDSPLRSNDALPEVHLRYVTEQGVAFARFVRSSFQQSSVILTVEQVHGMFIDS